MVEDVLPERVEFLEQRVAYLEQSLDRLWGRLKIMGNSGHADYTTPARPYNKCWLCDEDHRGLPCPRSLPSCSVSVKD